MTKLTLLLGIAALALGCATSGNAGLGGKANAMMRGAPAAVAATPHSAMAARHSAPSAATLASFHQSSVVAGRVARSAADRCQDDASQNPTRTILAPIQLNPRATLMPEPQHQRACRPGTPGCGDGPSRLNPVQRHFDLVGRPHP